MEHYYDAFLHDLDQLRLHIPYVKSTLFVCKSCMVCAQLQLYICTADNNEELDIEKRWIALAIFIEDYRGCVKCRWRIRELDVQSVMFLLKVHVYIFR